MSNSGSIDDVARERGYRQPTIHVGTCEYCRGGSAFRDAYGGNPYRREYQRMDGRYRRGSMSHDQRGAWRDRYPGPDAWKGAQRDGVGHED